MSRLLFDARPLLETGGVSRVAGRILQSVRASRPEAEITLITTGIKRPDLSAIAPGMTHLHLTIPNKLWSIICLLGLLSLDRAAVKIAGHSFDELILTNIGFVGIPQIPVTVVVHDLSFLIEPRWFPLKMRWWHILTRATRLIRNASRIWCVSHTTARDVEKIIGAPNEKMTVLSPEVVIGASVGSPLSGDRFADHSVAAERQPYQAPHPYVLAFDGNPRKNISTVITAMERLREDELFHHLQLIVIGSPTHRRPDHPTPWITFRSGIDDADLGVLYKNASALLYPSWYEGFGLPLHEAVGFGIPILASAHGALPETAPSEAILINPSKPHLWVSALRDALKKAQ